MPPRRTEKLKGVLAGRNKARKSSSKTTVKKKKKATKATKAKATTKKEKKPKQEKRTNAPKSQKKPVKRESRSLLLTASDFGESYAVDDYLNDVKPAAAAAAIETSILVAKAEYSPNSLAKCTSCRKKIHRDQKRYGIPEHSDRYNKDIYRYHHDKCCPAALKAQVPTAQQDWKRQKEESLELEQLIAQRQDLVEELKTLRAAFANKLQLAAAFLVFSNATLDELVYRLPTTQKKLLQVRGIGPVKCQSFGDPILRLILQYQQQQQQHGISSMGDRKPNACPAKRRGKQQQGPEVITIDDSDDDDDDEKAQHMMMDVVGETLTCEQLVHQKFAHAAAHGYMISVD